GGPPRSAASRLSSSIARRSKGRTHPARPISCVCRSGWKMPMTSTPISIARCGWSMHEMPLDFVHRHLHEILVQFRAQDTAQMARIGVAHDAERARRCNHDERFDPARDNLSIDMGDKLFKKASLALVMPVRLFDGATGGRN